jgi:DNA-binding transcriptional regulator GbsR (MarR family)
MSDSHTGVKLRQIKSKIYASFANFAATLGYSEVHGKIIAALFTAGRPMSLQELAKETNYSLSSISTSVDFLEFIDVVSKERRSGERRVYVRFEEKNLLEGLRKAVVLRVNKSLEKALREFNSYKNELKRLGDGPERARVLKTLEVLETEMLRLQEYVKLLGSIKPPESVKDA